MLGTKLGTGYITVAMLGTKHGLFANKFTLPTLVMVFYLGRMCGLHVLLWSHICTLMDFLAAEPRSTA